MIFGGLRVRNVLLSGAVTLVLLFLATSVFHITFVESSLRRTVMAVPGVTAVAAAPQGAETVVTVKLGPVANLGDTYKQLESAINQALGGRPYSVVLQDNPDQTLSNAYYNVHFAVEEAAVQGDFVSMLAQVDKVMHEAHGISYRIYVEPEQILVQMQDSGHYLYRVVPRQNPSGGVSSSAP